MMCLDPFTPYFATHPIPDATALGAYADWLDEQGDSHASAVRAEMAVRCHFPASDIHGVLAVERQFGVRFTPRQLAALATIPWSRDVLERCAGTHLLVAGWPFSIVDLHSRPERFLFGFPQPWYATETFAQNRRVGVRWHLLRKSALPDSMHQPFALQKQRLPDHERVAWACEVSYAVILHDRVTGERLLDNVCVRCADTTSHGARIFAGQIVSDALYIGPEWDDKTGHSHGVASAWRP